MANERDVRGKLPLETEKYAVERCEKCVSVVVGVKRCARLGRCRMRSQVSTCRLRHCFVSLYNSPSVTSCMYSYIT